MAILPRRAIRVLHFADAHIGVENYGRVDPATGLHTRLQDFLATLDATLERAVAEGCDLVVFAGDAFKARDPSPTHQREFARRIMKAVRAGLPVVLLAGNHDVPGAPGRATSLDIYAALQVPGVTVLDQPRVVPIATRAGPVLVAGLPYVPRNRLLTRDRYQGLTLQEIEAALGERLAAMADELAAMVERERGGDADVPALLVAHLAVAGGRAGSERAIMLGGETVVPLAALERPEFDYVALGHLHPHQVLGSEGKVVYAGSLDRVDFGEAEEPKGFVLVELARGRAGHRFVPNRVRPFVVLRVRVPDDAPDVTAAVLAAVTGPEAPALAGAVVKPVVEMDPRRWGELRLREVVRALEERAHHVLPVQREGTVVAPALRSPELTERSRPLAALEHYFRACRRPALDLEGLMARARALEEDLRAAEGVAP